MADHAVACLKELAESDFTPYDPAIPGTVPWLQQLAADDRAGTGEAELDGRWQQLAKCQNNFFAVLINGSFRAEARFALHEWSAGYSLRLLHDGRR